MDVHKACAAATPSCLGQRGSLASQLRPRTSSPALLAFDAPHNSALRHRPHRLARVVRITGFGRALWLLIDAPQWPPRRTWRDKACSVGPEYILSQISHAAGLPDPFVVVTVDGVRVRTKVQLLAVHCRSQRVAACTQHAGANVAGGVRVHADPGLAGDARGRRLTHTQASDIVVEVYDAKKFHEGDPQGTCRMCARAVLTRRSGLSWHGGRGRCQPHRSAHAGCRRCGLWPCCPVSIAAATSVLTLRLKKRVASDSVTGVVVVKLQLLSAGTPKASPTRPVPMFGCWPQHRMPTHSSAGRAESPATVAASPGSGWQPLLPEVFPSSPFQSLLPPAVRLVQDWPASQPQPSAPVCACDRAAQAVQVSWSDGGVSGPGTGLTYTLAVLRDGGEPVPLYAGFDSRHSVVGFRAGETLRFVVKASNFYGSSAFSFPSDPITVPLVRRALQLGTWNPLLRQKSARSSASSDDDERVHCPLFMAGFCFRCGRMCASVPCDGVPAGRGARCTTARGCRAPRTCRRRCWPLLQSPVRRRHAAVQPTRAQIPTFTWPPHWRHRWLTLRAQPTTTRT